MEIASPKKISGLSSIVLDSLRIIAALVVLCGHAMDEWIPSSQHSTQDSTGTYAHAAVVLFFVLSGYVIAFTTASRNRGARQYAVARLSRLVSIVLPALVITGIIQMAVHQIDPEVYKQYSRGNDLARYALAGTFLNEIWFFSAAPPINGPLWSLSFEFWYYVIFGCLIFRKKGLVGFGILALSCFIAGPKILLMMPIWLFGVIAFRLKAMRLKETLAWSIIAFLVFAAVFGMTFLPSYPFKLGAPPLFLANQFITDWFIGLLIGAALWLMPQEKADKTSDVRSWVLIYRKIADLTFPIYVLHRPLLVLMRSVVNYEENNRVQLSMVIFLVLLLAGGIGFLLEKQRPIWTRFFGRILKMPSIKTKPPVYE